ncbi:cytochrome p450 [Aureococcus anophagefferens]|nr:cytochrome p450 [Aureococcus anophagefferens]
MIGEDILTWKLEGYEARGAVAKYVAKEVFMPLIERRRAMVRAGAAPDDCLTALVASDGDEAFSDDDLLDQLVTLVGAGHDTSAYFAATAR